MEKKTFSMFINKRNKNINETTTKLEYYCHRSGYYKARGENIRHLKRQGTNKINGYCPANLKVTIKNGKYSVNYCGTHVGHKQVEDLGHLFLTKEERHQIAAKIASKVPMQVILNDVRDSVSQCQLQRMHLLTKKDLFNIERSYNLNASSVRHENDAISVEAWVNELRLNNCVSFYKRQDSLSEEYPELKKEDFALIIMTDGQKELLAKFGNDCICIDGTHGLNGYGFELHTLLVLDDIREGYPCAFLISNRSDVAVFKIFFKCIEEKLGYKILAKVFMSDMAEAYYKAWLEVMYPPNFRLFCAWHVDRAWRKNLNKLTEKKVQVYKILRLLMQEREINTFFNIQEKFLLFLNESVETLEFAQYYKDNYMSKPEFWAYCFRLNSGINTNMHIERMHRTIKHIYLHGKFVKRLDKAIDGIMKFVRDKLFERVIILYKGKVSTKLSDLRHRHKLSETMDIKKVIYNNLTYTVASSSTNEMYTVEEVKLDCTCKLICDECNTCIHHFSCSCLDNSIKWNMCKHIHLVCRYINQLPKAVEIIEEESFLAENNLIMDVNKKDQEISSLIETITTNKPMQQKNYYDQVCERKQKIMDEMARLQNEIKLVNSIEEIEVFERNMAPIWPCLAAVRDHRKSHVGLPEVSASIKNIPPNKKIEPQRRLYRTKKQPKGKKLTLNKPSAQEADLLAAQLLLKNKLE
ncbi:uncharacterized protein LOC126880257 isoform X1 [Diabrotica virgifera virgifera]|nr:uncharacterized protein LOC126880257 isoform X1 [Diabrotica virgifera virgifera]